MDILIQDQTFSETFPLHEALLYACEGAIEGSGAFAFVSMRGAELYLQDQLFESMIDRGKYRLIVGMDAVTDIAALSRLEELENLYENLEVFAFLHNTPHSLFHPKFSWFKNPTGGTIVVGSGNLTVGGLRRNREIFAVADVSLKEIGILQNRWNRWLAESAGFLKPVNDEAVLDRARSNQRRRSAIRTFTEQAGTSEQDAEGSEEQLDEDVNDWQFSGSNRVLIAEIPQGSDRWNQANFDAQTFRDFFGAIPGKSGQRILLRNVRIDGTLADIEVRPSISVQSKNYRFELAAASGISYPSNGRPIGIFVRISTRMFLYVLSLPSGDSHGQLDDWLCANWTGRTDRMKRIVRDYSQVSSLLSSTGIYTFASSME